MIRSTQRRNATASRTFQADSCGCAMGALFMGAALGASVLWFAWHHHEYSVARAGVRILTVTFAAAVLGKLVGIAAYRLRTGALRNRSQAPQFESCDRAAFPAERPLGMIGGRGK